jgi:hypothetical protein
MERSCTCYRAALTVFVFDLDLLLADFAMCIANPELCPSPEVCAERDLRRWQRHTSNRQRTLQRKLANALKEPAQFEEAPEMYEVWHHKRERLTKIVIDPWAEKAA